MKRAAPPRVARPLELAFNLNLVDAPGRSPNRRWVAELVDASGWLTVPLCVAWLTDYRPTLGVTLDFVIVPFEDQRRKGYGTRIVAELRKVWPDLLEYSDPVTPVGEKFYDSLPADARTA